MIKIKVNKDSISIKGHANYDEFGKDIVCAAVSATVMTSIEAIAKIAKNAIDIKQSKDNLDIIINERTDILNSLLENMLDCLKEIEKQYPKNIKINDKEE